MVQKKASRWVFAICRVVHSLLSAGVRHLVIQLFCVYQRLMEKTAVFQKFFTFFLLF